MRGPRPRFFGVAMAATRYSLDRAVAADAALSEFLAGVDRASLSVFDLALLCIAAGHNAGAIGRALGVRPEVVRRWKHRGPNGSPSSSVARGYEYRRSPRKVTPEVEAAVAASLASGASIRETMKAEDVAYHTVRRQQAYDEGRSAGRAEVLAQLRLDDLPPSGRKRVESL